MTSFLLACVVKGSVVLAIALAATRLLRHHPAALRHAVLTAGVFGALGVPIAAAVVPAVGAPHIVQAAWRSLGTLTTVDHETVPTSANAAARATAARARDDALDDVRLGGGDPRAPMMHPSLVLLGVWLLGVVVLMVRTLRSLGAARRIVAQSSHMTSAPLGRIMRELAARVGMADDIGLVASATMTTPATIGVVRPVIVVPATADEWPTDDARSVLAHEIAHIARRDCLTDLVAQLACAVYWFNPLVWSVARRMRMERERACDDLVLATGAAPKRYATLLIETARAARGLALPTVGALAMARPSELESRLLAILDPERRRGALARRTGWLLAGLAVVAIVPTAALRLDAAPVAVLDDQSSGGQQRAEPDTRGDSIANPRSELLPVVIEVARLRASRAGIHGPDSTLVVALRADLDRVPHGDEDLVRERAAWALSRIRDDRLVEPLIESLGDRDWRVRAYAAWALAGSHDRRAIPALLIQLDDPVWRMRAMAASALAAIADPRARPTMIRALGDDAWQVRVSAVEYLGALGDASLARLARDKLNDRHAAVRNAAEQALTKLQAR